MYPPLPCVAAPLLEEVIPPGSLLGDTAPVPLPLPLAGAPPGIGAPPGTGAPPCAGATAPAPGAGTPLGGATVLEGTGTDRGQAAVGLLLP